MVLEVGGGSGGEIPCVCYLKTGLFQPALDRLAAANLCRFARFDKGRFCKV